MILRTRPVYPRVSILRRAPELDDAALEANGLATKRTSGRRTALPTVIGVFLIALALHGLIFAGIRLAPKPLSPAPEATSAPSVLLAAHGRQTEAKSSLWHVVRIFDPTVLVKASLQHGFSSVLADPRPTPLSPPPELAARASLSPERDLPPPPLVTPASSTSGPPREQTLPPPPPIAVPPPQSVPQNTLWYRSDGSPVEGLPAYSAERIRELAGERRPATPSTVRLESVQDHLRVRLVESCGIPELDRLAIRDMRRGLRPLLDANRPAETRPLGIRNLPPEPGGHVDIQACWRLPLAPETENQTPQPASPVPDTDE